MFGLIILYIYIGRYTREFGFTNCVLYVRVVIYREEEREEREDEEKENYGLTRTQTHTRVTFI